MNRGRTLALNGVWGNLGVAFAAGITAATLTPLTEEEQRMVVKLLRKLA